MTREMNLGRAVATARTWLALASFAGALFMALGAGGAVAFAFAMRSPSAVG
jgi:hypothetical protein